MGVLWVYYGCVMAVLWVCYRCVLGVLWVCYGSVVGVLWVCYGCVMGVLWVCYGCVMGVLWVCYGCVMGVLWVCYGCVMDVLWVHVVHHTEWCNLTLVRVLRVEGNVVCHHSHNILLRYPVTTYNVVRMTDISLQEREIIKVIISCSP